MVLRPPLIHTDRVRAVIPTFRDWEDARVTVESLLECRPSPKEIVLVSDNPEPSSPAWARRYPIRLVSYGKNLGPAHARNVGALLDTGRLIDWLYFTDTGCTRNTAFFSILAEASMQLPETTVAIAGPVNGLVASSRATPINLYMTEEQILNPPMDENGPQGLVTANAAVSVEGFRAVNGFDTSYPFAAGEDLDLGLRMRRLGSIGWAKHAQVWHRFAESMDDFRRRFVRYGAGNAHLEHRLALPAIGLSKIVAYDPDLQHLADLQAAAMQQGYESHHQALASSDSKTRRNR
jgi:GT2 family glycosyltransferase